MVGVMARFASPLAKALPFATSPIAIATIAIAVATVPVESIANAADGGASHSPPPLPLLLPTPAAEPAPSLQSSPLRLTPAQLFALADRARDAGDFATAEAAYRALARNPLLDLRSEARFRLALMLADRQHRVRDDAVLLRQILDENPQATAVRLELARLQALIGDRAGSERQLRAAQAAGIPPEVERAVRFFAAGLAERKRTGASIELALAPDSNINRATRSDTLGTTIGNLTLDQDAVARSGVGLTLRGQAYARTPLATGFVLLARATSDASLYRHHRFDDVAMQLQLGPEVSAGRDVILIAAVPSWRWYGGRAYSTSIAATAAWRHALASASQLRVEASAGHVANHRNPLQSGGSYAASLAIDRALSPRMGGGVQVGGQREALRAPGYATTSGSIGTYLFRDLGRVTVVASIGYSHLAADARLALFARRRIDNRLTTSLSGTFRALQLAGFAPLARIK